MKTIARASIVENFQDDTDQWIIHNVPVDAWYVVADDGGSIPAIGNEEGVSLSFLDGDRSYSIVLNASTIEWLAVELAAGRVRFDENNNPADE